jgi:hypothetical protein
VLRSNQPNLFVTKIKANVGEIEIHRQFLSTQRASGDNHHIANNLDPAHRLTEKSLSLSTFNIAGLVSYLFYVQSDIADPVHPSPQSPVQTPMPDTYRFFHRSFATNQFHGTGCHSA